MVYGIQFSDRVCMKLKMSSLRDDLVPVKKKWLGDVVSCGRVNFFKDPLWILNRIIVVEYISKFHKYLLICWSIYFICLLLVNDLQMLFHLLVW
jgi:hypothetical protein